MEPNTLLVLGGAFLIISFLYSSVGFGGGSSYLALLSLFLIDFYTIRTTALLCNILVVSGSLFWYFRSGKAILKDFIPFIVTSVPLAFIGASLELSETLFFILLGVSLVFSASVLFWQTFEQEEEEKPRSYPSGLSYVLGGGIGFLSGLVGIGGGIFLAPILLHLRFREPVRVAALASFFICVNSIAGMGGLLVAGTFDLIWPDALFLLLAVLLGGQLGIRMSLKRFSAQWIQRITAVLVFAVGIRVLWSHLLPII